MMMKKTRTIDGATYTVTYGFDTKFAAKYKQRPYFSITLDVTEGKRWVSGGADSDTIAEVFPELANVLQWHLADHSATPMHYVANTLYWRDHFPTQAEVQVYAERDWTGDSPETWDRDTLRVYLVTRQAALMDNMRADLAAVGVTVPN